MSIAHPRSRDRFVGGRLLLRALLSRMLGKPQSEFTVLPDNTGVPRLSGERLQLHLSISHGATYDGVGIALAPVGIDVEEEAPPDFRLLFETILGPAERAAMDMQPKSTQANSFMRAWTRKEAVLKAAGTGFLVDPRSVETFWGPGPGRVHADTLPDAAYAVADLDGPVSVALAGERLVMRIVPP